MRRLPALWHQARPVLRAAPAALEIPLRRPRIARRLACLFLGAQLVYLAELVVMRQWLSAALVGAFASSGAWLCLRRSPAPGEQPRRLIIAADGRLQLLLASGGIVPVQLHAATQFLGPWILLVLTPGGAKLRLLLGPDTVEPQLLAALRRRLMSARDPPEE